VLPRSGRVDGGVDHARAALALGEPRAAPVRSGWAEATQRGRGNGGKVVRKRGRGMKICRVKYYVDFGGFFIEKRAYAPLRWNHLEHEDTSDNYYNSGWLPGGLAHRRVGSKASWQIALIPHGCAYTQVLASGVVKHIL
jgi:hypothetical protein